MRKTFATAIALTVALTLAAPAVAAPRHRNEPPTFAALVTKMVKRVFGIGASADPAIPVPLYTTTTTTTTEEEPKDPKGKK